MTPLMTDIICSKTPNVSLLAYVDDTVLLGLAEDVTKAIAEIQAEVPWMAPSCRRPKHRSGLPGKAP